MLEKDEVKLLEKLIQFQLVSLKLEDREDLLDDANTEEEVEGQHERQCD
jgi:hypothetical protein